MARPQLMEDALPELLKYHVVAGTPALAAGPVESLQGVSLDVTTDGAVKVRIPFSRDFASLSSSIGRPHLLLAVIPYFMLYAYSCSAWPLPPTLMPAGGRRSAGREG